ncbi:cytochrome c oxidase assembly factor 6 homolog isoform X2 [Ischnura elegans]|nr:cytochrome c oxidase assembly factor 6 homolog isoform X2 [Ischnura elegans]XP_046384225.1 cytochrome c oxidase assembly factor 6 homolog isoform X2 [Ischnura elegans]
MSFPTKDERKKCWDARDKYWSCLDVAPEEKEQCLQLRKLYETSCPAQWVKHFDRKRTYLQFKEKIEKDGSQPDAHLSVSSQQAFRGCPHLNDDTPIVKRHRVYRLLVST